MFSNAIEILLVEDNPDDVQITKRAFKEANLANRLYVTRDGQEALDFLFHEGQYQNQAQATIPGLILLDINMPRVNGIEVLKRIKSNDKLKIIPVIMLTISKQEEDLEKCYFSGCNSFIQKPVDFKNFIRVIKEIGLYWGLLNIPYPIFLDKDEEQDLKG